MDYKELITEIRAYIVKTYQVGFQPEICSRAADAIETLLAERDVAVEELRGICWCCANGKPWEKAGPLSNLTACEHLAECGVLECGWRSSKCQHWQWRGPQKGGGA